MRRGQQMFMDYVNTERMGVTVNGLKYGLSAFWVDDKSSKTLVTNSTAFASRGFDADFIYAGYASGLTTYTTMQAGVEGKIMMAPGAASTSVYVKNDLSFGMRMANSSPTHPSFFVFYSPPHASLD